MQEPPLPPLPPLPPRDERSVDGAAPAPSRKRRLSGDGASREDDDAAGAKEGTDTADRAAQPASATCAAAPHAAASAPSSAGAAAAAAAPTSAPPTPVAAPRDFGDGAGDSPLLALVRQEWLAWHHRRLALAVAAAFPTLSGDSKTLRSCRAEGLLPGLQGLHARFLFGQLRAQSVAIDPLLPHAPDAIEKDSVKEMALWGGGAPPGTAERVAADLAAAMGHAARSCAQARAALLSASEDARAATGGGAPAAGEGERETASAPQPGAPLPICGTLRLIAMPSESFGAARSFGSWRSSGGGDGGGGRLLLV
jgi:hypothetical protein